MNSKSVRLILAAATLLAIALTGCGGGTFSAGGGGTNGSGGSNNGTVNMMVSDAPTNDWATVGVKILSITFNPQGGGTPVTVYTAPSTVPVTNLVQLDGIGELLESASVPAGTYTSATVTISANPGDLTLTASEDPDTGFAGTAGATVPSGQVQIQGATGNSGSKTVSFNVNFASNLVVMANQNSQLDLEFDLAHPAFIIAQAQATAAQTLWAINFSGPVHHHPIKDITRFVLRDMYGTVSSVSSDDKSMVITRDFPTVPPVSPETEVTSSHNVTILADATNGTLFYDLDNSPITPTTIMNFSSVQGFLTSGTKYLRVTARYQVDGSLVAVRIYASSTFNTVFLSPEGHVLHVNTTTDIMRVASEDGQDVPLQVTSATQFFFRTPASAVADATPIGTGTAFLSNIKRGFKVHVTANPLTTPMTALTVDIEWARFDGVITNATGTGFDYTRVFATPVDSYTNFPLTYIPNATANGFDPMHGTQILGFKWWNFSFPTIVTSNVTDTSTTQAITDFVSAVSGSVNFGGSIGAIPAYGESGAVWSTTSNGWAVPYTILIPGPLPLGSALTGWSSSTNSFTMVAPPNANANPAVTIDASAVSGSATLVYEVNRSSTALLTITPVDLTTPAGQNTMTTDLVTGALVKVAGVPEPTSGHLKAYIILFYTGPVLPVS